MKNNSNAIVNGRWNKIVKCGLSDSIQKNAMVNPMMTKSSVCCQIERDIPKEEHFYFEQRFFSILFDDDAF